MISQLTSPSYNAKKTLHRLNKTKFKLEIQQKQIISIEPHKKKKKLFSFFYFLICFFPHIPIFFHISLLFLLCLYFYLHMHLIYLAIYPDLCLFVCSFIRVSFDFFVHSFIYFPLSLFIYPFLYLFIYSVAHSPIHLSISIIICLFS